MQLILGHPLGTHLKAVAHGGKARPAQMCIRDSIEALGCQTGPIFLTYRDQPVLDMIVGAATTSTPLYDFTCLLYTSPALLFRCAQGAWNLRHAHSHVAQEQDFLQAVEVRRGVTAI